MNQIDMMNGVRVAGDWRTLRVSESAALMGAARADVFHRSAATHHAIPQPKRRTAAATVASVNRGFV